MEIQSGGVHRPHRGMGFCSSEAEQVLGGQPEKRCCLLKGALAKGPSWVVWGTCQAAPVEQRQPQTSPGPKGHRHQFPSMPFLPHGGAIRNSRWLGRQATTSGRRPVPCSSLAQKQNSRVGWTWVDGGRGEVLTLNEFGVVTLLE